MTLPPDLALLDSAGKDALILALLERLNDLAARLEILEAENAALRAENAALRAENAELRAKLNLPPKRPDNSSTPPSRGHKGSSASPRASRMPGRIGSCIRTRPSGATLQLRSASIARPTFRASNRPRFTLTIGSSFLRSNLK